MSEQTEHMGAEESAELAQRALSQMIEISAREIRKLTGRGVKLLICAAIQPMSEREQCMVLTATSMSTDMALDTMDGVRPELLLRAQGQEDSEHFVGPTQPSNVNAEISEAIAELMAIIEGAIEQRDEE